MYQWVEWLYIPGPEDEVPNIDWLILVFTRTKRYYGKPYTDIKSWTHPVDALKVLIKKRFNLKGELVFFPYSWPDGMKEFSCGGAHKGWKDYLGITHSTYNGGHIETDHHVI